MRAQLVFVALLSWACSSAPLADDEAAGSGGSGASTSTPPSACSGALKQSLGLVDEVSSGEVSTIEERDGERTLYIDASAGGVDGQDEHAWVYVSLASGQAVALTDLAALESSGWDLAFKRFVVRTNGGDSGPGRGGAIRVALDWGQVDSSTLGDKSLPSEAWFDDACMLEVDENQELITTFTGWSEYDESKHVLNAADVTYITAGADGSLYKVAILDYYGTPSGASGAVAGHYLVRVAPLP
jgi:HmuY protein